ncbi:15985_t:CDS:1, partial [Dentiscutata erythropus]
SSKTICMFLLFLIYVLLLIDAGMFYLFQRTASGQFAPNQEEHYPEFLPSSRSSSVQVEDSIMESIPDAPPSYQEAVAEMPTDSFMIATSDI